MVHFDFVDPPSPEAKGYEKCWAVAVFSQHLFETFLAQHLNGKRISLGQTDPKMRRKTYKVKASNTLATEAAIPCL